MRKKNIKIHPYISALENAGHGFTTRTVAHYPLEPWINWLYAVVQKGIEMTRELYWEHIKRTIATELKCVCWCSWHPETCSSSATELAYIPSATPIWHIIPITTSHLFRGMNQILHRVVYLGEFFSIFHHSEAIIRIGVRWINESIHG
jgi:hypothetical protein